MIWERRTLTLELVILTMRQHRRKLMWIRWKLIPKLGEVIRKLNKIECRRWGHSTTSMGRISQCMNQWLKRILHIIIVMKHLETCHCKRRTEENWENLIFSLDVIMKHSKWRVKDIKIVVKPSKVGSEMAL